MDEQVKIRGYRIELGEIESVIRRQAEIRDVAVIAREDKSGDKYICAYVVSVGQTKEVKLTSLKKELRRDLPEYMIPSYLVNVEQLPVTINGKLDRRALPDPEILGTREYAAPRNELEETLVNIFQEVLGLEQVSIHDSFFEIGGHSLKATRVVNLIESTVGVRLPLKTLFERTTVVELSEFLHQEEEHTYEAIPQAEKQSYYPMSSAQRRMYVIHELEDLGTVYNMPGVTKIEGELDLDKIKEIFHKLTQRHESLRTSFHMIDGEPVQRIEEQVEIEIAYEEVEIVYGEEDPVYAEIAVTCEEVTDIEKRKATAAELLQEFVRPFHLGKAPLLRAKVVKYGSDKNLLMFDMHHIISDGATVNIISKEFSQLYNGEELKALDVQYKDYSEWMRKKDISNQEAYWIDQLSDEIPVLELPLDYVRPQIQQFSGSSFDVRIHTGTKEMLKDLCAETGTTEYMVLLSSFMVLLNKYTRQEDIIIGSPISGRTHQDTENMVGMFVNTLAMRGKPEGHKSFSSFLAEIREICLKGYENQEYPFEDIVDKISVKRDMSRNPIFDVLFVLQNNEEEKVSIEGLQFGTVETGSTVAKFDLTLTLSSNAEGYVANWEYSNKLFEQETIRRMAEHFSHLLDKILETPDKRISEIEMIREVEKNQVLFDFNDTKTAYPKDKTIHELFEAQVGQTPLAEAVVCPNERFTYDQLDRRSNEIRGEMLRKGVREGELIGIVSEKSVHMIAGILAILKCGCGYVPIDRDYPESRLQFMLEDCDIKTILCGTKNIHHLERVRGQRQVIDIQGQYEEYKESYHGTAHDVAYVIYTSGSTGQPKGVVVEHQNVVRLVKNTNYVDFEGARILQTGALSFDAATFEIWGALLNGGMLCLVEADSVTVGEKLSSTIQNQNINMMWMTSQLFNNLIDMDQQWLAGLRTLLIGGEKLSEKHVNKLLQHRQDIQLINGYGPTENTTFSVCLNITREYNNIPIGKPISNSTAYIMNGNTLSGIGMPGELCVGGDGVARGYLNRDELTQEKFVDNPYVKGERMYRTGDLARWLPDGNIEYLGRMDEQVKIRGYRIELGEIESVIRRQEGIRDVAVITTEDHAGDKYICAYVVSEDQEKEINTAQMRSALKKELPEYMIPSYLVSMDQLPVTTNGKLDRRMLPLPEVNSTQEYVAPRNELEETLVHIFSEVLGLERIGIDDNFFEMGGDSIKAIRIISKVREHGFDLDIRTLVQERDIRNISSKVEKVQFDHLEEYQQPVEGLVQWTPIQHEFIGWELSKPWHFNQAVMIHSSEKLDVDHIHSTLKHLTMHHDALRSVFDDGTQRIRSVDEPDMYDLAIYNYQDIKNEKALEQIVEEHCNEIQGSIDLKNGPLMKVGLFDTLDGMHIFICIHHLVVDGVSWRILLEDFNTVYTQIINHEEVNLPLKTASYQKWSEGLITYGESYLLRRELPYWKTILDKTESMASISKSLKLQSLDEVDHRNSEVYNLEFELSTENTNKLIYDCSKAYNTEINDLLLAALSIAVSRCFGLQSVAIELESHGRHPIEPQVCVDRTVGWFTNIYPVILECQTDDIGTTIKNTKDMLRNVPNHGLGYGILKFLTENELKEHSGSHVEVSFNYLGDISSSEGGVFNFSKLNSGKMSSDENRINKLITVDGILQDSQLAFTIGYHGSIHDHDAVQFCDCFKLSLNDVITHCSNSNETQYTISDYGNDIEWSDSELEDVLKLFEGDEEN
ncbi:Plipastatin synthase subunit C [compost metagenome]